MEHTTAENAQNEKLGEIHQMVEKVKQDREVAFEFMKIFEREEMLIQQGIAKGREQERSNTERERLRAERAERMLEQLQQELKR